MRKYFDTERNLVFDKTEILDHESNAYKRNIIEMIYINIIPDTVNI